jgi:hypothetical protein
VEKWAADTEHTHTHIRTYSWIYSWSYSGAIPGLRPGSIACSYSGIFCGSDHFAHDLYELNICQHTTHKDGTAVARIASGPIPGSFLDLFLDLFRDLSWTYIWTYSWTYLWTYFWTYVWAFLEQLPVDYRLDLGLFGLWETCRAASPSPSSPHD